MIEVKFDNSLQLPTIEVPIYSETGENDSLAGADRESQQTKIDGIEVPLFRLNNQTILFNQIKYMKLTGGQLPTLQVTIIDSAGLIKSLDTPTSDNLIQMQIIPPFDNAYKKINMTFYITRMQIEKSEVSITATYNIPKLYDSAMTAYGQVSSYELVEQIAHDLSLGFCSNISTTDDKRWIYNPSGTIIDLLDREIEMGGRYEHVLEWWIDWWNNINLIDLYDEYNLIESEDNMQIWIQDFSHNQSDSTDEVSFHQQLAMITNNPISETSPLYITDYKPVSESAMMSDQTFEVYKMDDLDKRTIMILDGDTHNDIFNKYVYGGEVFGDFDYLTQRTCREMFLNKIVNQYIEVELPKPVIGLMKGGKVNFYWYEVGNLVTEEIVESGTDVNTNIPKLPNIKTEDTNWILNSMISGQYYIIDSTLEFEQSGKLGKWSHKFKLGRPADQINKYNENRAE